MSWAEARVATSSTTNVHDFMKNSLGWEISPTPGAVRDSTLSVGNWTDGLPQTLLLHLLPQAERTHIRPHFFDVSQALFLGAALACVVPAQGVFPVRRPDRILLFVIYYDFVHGMIFWFFRHSIRSSTQDVSMADRRKLCAAAE